MDQFNEIWIKTGEKYHKVLAFASKNKSPRFSESFSTYYCEIQNFAPSIPIQFNILHQLHRKLHTYFIVFQLSSTV